MANSSTYEDIERAIIYFYSEGFMHAKMEWSPHTKSIVYYICNFAGLIGTVLISYVAVIFQFLIPSNR